MLKSLVAIGALLSAAPALAQSTDGTLPDPNDQSDTFTIGAGAAYIPDYEGSDDYRIIPAAAILVGPTFRWAETTPTNPMAQTNCMSCSWTTVGAPFSVRSWRRFFTASGAARA